MALAQTGVLFWRMPTIKTSDSLTSTLYITLQRKQLQNYDYKPTSPELMAFL